MEPSPELPGRSVSNGRSATGQFLLGNAGGPGNPHGGKVSRLRSAMLNAITEDDIAAVITKLLELAKSGNIPAAKLLLDRACGKPITNVTARVRPAPAPANDQSVKNLTEVKRSLALRLQRLIDARESQPIDE